MASPDAIADAERRRRMRRTRKARPHVSSSPRLCPPLALLAAAASLLLTPWSPWTPSEALLIERPPGVSTAATGKAGGGGRGGARVVVVDSLGGTAPLSPFASSRRRDPAAAAELRAAPRRTPTENGEGRRRRRPPPSYEAAGVLGGYGLLKDGLRGRVRRRLKERRRDRRSRRVRSLLSRGSATMAAAAADASGDARGGGGKGGKGGKGGGDGSGNWGKEQEAYDETSLDAMRSRAGVLRTEIRLRQAELGDLERLIRQETGVVERKDLTSFSAYMDAVVSVVMGDGLVGGRVSQRWNGAAADSTGAGGNGNGNGNGNGGSKREAEEDAELMFQVDLMRTSAEQLKGVILAKEMRLQDLERRIVCRESDELGLLEKAVANGLDAVNDLESPVTVVQRNAYRFVRTFGESTSVLKRKLELVGDAGGGGGGDPDYGAVSDFIVQETAAGARIVSNLLTHPDQLARLVDPDTPALVPHVPAILARLDRIEPHVEPIVEKVLNNQKHLRAIEPYLDRALERFDDIEPHLPWILDNIDALAPHTGLLLKHIDELLLYAEVDEYEAGAETMAGKKGDYAFAEQLLPYVEVYVSKLDVVGPHLPLLRPHLPLLLKHDRIRILTPHVGKLFAKGYKDLSASANMDILLFWFGWALRIPFVPKIFFSLPGSPGIVSFLANRLPKRLVRGRCADVRCFIDGDYGGSWNSLTKGDEPERNEKEVKR